MAARYVFSLPFKVSWFSMFLQVGSSIARMGIARLVMAKIAFLSDADAKRGGGSHPPPLKNAISFFSKIKKSRIFLNKRICKNIL